MSRRCEGAAGGWRTGRGRGPAPSGAPAASASASGRPSSRRRPCCSCPSASSSSAILPSGPGNTFTSSCQLKCGGHRSSAPIPWISLLSQILWEVSAVGDDGFLVLVPNGRFLTLQPLVHRLPVTTADC
uniref:Uncharacterized protein n=1 Tax=Oryza glumipatula TaxID=40148 RepID=A0A0D9ZDN4_9ORYZ